jgi:hypothetical protein
MARIILLTLLLTCLAPHGAASDYNGAELYVLNCANCHGVYGEGDGVMMPDLSVVLLDLRYLSERNGGRFPGEFVRKIIDGRETRAQHGPTGMPVWGVEFTRGEGFDNQAQERVTRKIDALADFLQSSQIQ